jgi:hypothetical protein
MKDRKKILQYIIDYKGLCKGLCIDEKINCIDCPIYKTAKHHLEKIAFEMRLDPAELFPE